MQQVEVGADRGPTGCTATSSMEPSSQAGPQRLLQLSTGHGRILPLVVDLAGNMWLDGVSPERGRQVLRERHQAPRSSTNGAQPFILSLCSSLHAAARPVGRKTPDPTLPWLEEGDQKPSRWGTG